MEVRGRILIFLFTLYITDFLQAQKTEYYGPRFGYSYGLNFRSPQYEKDNSFKNMLISGALAEVNLPGKFFIEIAYFENRRSFMRNWPDLGNYQIKEYRNYLGMGFGYCYKNTKRESLLLGVGVGNSHYTKSVYSDIPSLSNYIDDYLRKNHQMFRVILKYQYHLTNFIGVGGYFYSGLIPIKQYRSTNMNQILGLYCFLQVRTEKMK